MGFFPEFFAIENNIIFVSLLGFGKRSRPTRIPMEDRRTHLRYEFCTTVFVERYYDAYYFYYTDTRGIRMTEENFSTIP